MSRASGQLSIYLAVDVGHPEAPRLLVARSFEQADSMVPATYATRIATQFECYRFGKVGVELQYYYPKKVTA